jgi:hypothetical protein
VQDLGVAAILLLIEPVAMTSNRVVLHILPLTGLVLLSACRSDLDFHSTVLYEALRGQYQVLVEARGVVSRGHDVSERSNAYVTFSPPEPRDLSLPPETVMIEVAQRASRLYFASEFLPDDAGRPQYADVLSGLMTRYRYTVNSDEVDELVLIIEGALAGPKGTHVEGQTRLFKVVSAHFE